MDVVIVESPAKARTINKYLGEDFIVLPSYGHVRDLPARDGSVRPEEGFAITYETAPEAVKHVRAIAKAMRGADTLYLATDPDREGEAISWHVLAALKQGHAVAEIPVKRVVFTEITRRAVLEAMGRPRDLDMNLINAQQARRALDYLVGFGLSPVLWRKLPGAKSAGRVQSVALRLICERELEIEAFDPREYWTVLVTLSGRDGAQFSARLVALEGKRLEKFSLGNEAQAMAARTTIEAADFAVERAETKPLRRNPQPPFTTSTLQQEASRKLGFSAKRTMRVAQRLYEGVEVGGESVGLITYMRTDGLHIADEALGACRAVIKEQFGASYLPEKPRLYRSRAKNVQEAHEAIRPTDMARLPEHAGRHLDNDGRRLYELVWKRSVASQMASARIQQTVLHIASSDGRVGLRATGQVVSFAGFLKLYEEGRDEKPGEEEDKLRLPPLAEGERLRREAVEPRQHFTEPPPRYSEATLVKRLEELGIGRPSTYANILSVLQEREYVRLEKRRFVAEDRGRLVTAFLSNFFRRYVAYDFTAELENKLDQVSAGRVDWKAVLGEFWNAFSQAVTEAKELKIKEVIAALDDFLAPHLFPGEGGEADPRLCPSCGSGRLGLKLGKFGAFVGCSNYPDCRYTRPLAGAAGAAVEAGDDGPRELGADPDSGLTVSLRKGPYGYYVQLGEAGGEEKPKRASLPGFLAPDQVDLRAALDLLALPRMIGAHPESSKPISAGINRYGPYLEHDGAFTRLPADENVLDIGLNRAVELLAQGQGRRRARPLRVIGEHPGDGQQVVVMDGRYGPYIRHNRVNAPLPKGAAPEEVTLDEALDALTRRAAKAKSGGRSRRKSTGAGKGAGLTRRKSGRGRSRGAPPGDS